MSLTLYYHPLSSFCHKVLIALYENNIEFERRIIDLGNGTDRAELQAIWPFNKCDSKTISRIMHTPHSPLKKNIGQTIQMKKLDI